MSRVRLIEALAWKRGVNKLAKEPTDIGSKLNLSSTLPVTPTGEAAAKVQCGHNATPKARQG